MLSLEIIRMNRVDFEMSRFLNFGVVHINLFK